MTLWLFSSSPGTSREYKLLFQGSLVISNYFIYIIMRDVKRTFCPQYKISTNIVSSKLSQPSPPLLVTIELQHGTMDGQISIIQDEP